MIDDEGGADTNPAKAVQGSRSSYSVMQVGQACGLYYN